MPIDLLDRVRRHQKRLIGGCLLGVVGCAGVLCATMVGGCSLLLWILPGPPEPITPERRPELVASLLEEHNRRRETPLEWNARLERAAQAHADHMAEFEFVGHVDRRNGETVGVRARREG